MAMEDRDRGVVLLCDVAAGSLKITKRAPDKSINPNQRTSEIEVVEKSLEPPGENVQVPCPDG